jgi:hypothetical protein
VYIQIYKKKNRRVYTSTQGYSSIGPCHSLSLFLDDLSSCTLWKLTKSNKRDIHTGIHGEKRASSSGKKRKKRKVEAPGTYRSFTSLITINDPRVVSSEKKKALFSYAAYIFICTYQRELEEGVGMEEVKTGAACEFLF